jgi:opine dehydrogenase
MTTTNKKYFSQLYRPARPSIGRHAGDGTSTKLGLPFIRSNSPVPFFNRYSTRRPSLKKQQLGVAILGAGHGGLALAGYLARLGHRVNLWNRSEARIADVQARGGIQLSLPGADKTLAKIAKATTEMAAVLADVRLVLVAVPASGHADVARACAPYLRDGQTVLLLPGRTGGALEFRRVLQRAGCRALILLGEANTFPLAARCVGAAEAVVFGTKEVVQVAALPASRTAELLAAWKPILPMLTSAGSVLHTGLANVGAILHPVITLLNADRIARGESFDFYTDGVTPGVAEVLAAADAERLQIARAYGVDVSSLPEWIAAAYGHQAPTMHQAVGGNPAYVGIKAPTTVVHRYLLEDVPTGLIPLLAIGEAAGLHLPTLRGLVNLARKTLGVQRWEGPRTLDALGLAGLGTEEIRAHVEGAPTAIPSNNRIAAFGLAWELATA